MVAIAAATLTGCGSLPSGAAPAADPVATGVLHQAAAALERSGTASFTERAVTAQRTNGGSAMTEEKYFGTGAYDLTGEKWTVERNFYLPGQTRPGAKEWIAVTGRDQFTRFSNPDYAADTVRYREYNDTFAGDHTTVGTADLGASPPRPLLLLALITATSTRPNPAGGTVVNGVLKAPWAFDSFGTGDLFSDLGLDYDSLRGWAPVRIEIDPSGRVSTIRVELDGSAVLPTSDDGRTLAGRFAKGSYRADFDGYGKPVTITDPDPIAEDTEAFSV